MSYGVNKGMAAVWQRTIGARGCTPRPFLIEISKNKKTLQEKSFVFLTIEGRPTSFAAPWQRLSTGGVSKFRDKLVDGTVECGNDKEFTERTFSQLECFGSYGFPEIPTASIAFDRLRAVVDEVPPSGRICAALLNAQPMRIYLPRLLTEYPSSSLALICA
jgi:hypothetical protein